MINDNNKSKMQKLFKFALTLSLVCLPFLHTGCSIDSATSSMRHGNAVVPNQQQMPRQIDFSNWYSKEEKVFTPAGVEVLSESLKSAEVLLLQLYGQGEEEKGCFFCSAKVDKALSWGLKIDSNEVFCCARCLFGQKKEAKLSKESSLWITGKGTVYKKSEALDQDESEEVSLIRGSKLCNVLSAVPYVFEKMCELPRRPVVQRANSLLLGESIESWLSKELVPLHLFTIAHAACLFVENAHGEVGEVSPVDLFFKALEGMVPSKDPIILAICVDLWVGVYKNAIFKTNHWNTRVLSDIADRGSRFFAMAALREKKLMNQDMQRLTGQFTQSLLLEYLDNISMDRHFLQDKVKLIAIEEDNGARKAVVPVPAAQIQDKEQNKERHIIFDKLYNKEEQSFTQEGRNFLSAVLRYSENIISRVYGLKSGIFCAVCERPFSEKLAYRFYEDAHIQKKINHLCLPCLYGSEKTFKIGGDWYSINQEKLLKAKLYEEEILEEGEKPKVDITSKELLVAMPTSSLCTILEQASNLFKEICNSPRKAMAERDQNALTVGEFIEEKLFENNLQSYLFILAHAICLHQENKEEVVSHKRNSSINEFFDNVGFDMFVLNAYLCMGLDNTLKMMGEQAMRNPQLKSLFKAEYVPFVLLDAGKFLTQLALTTDKWEYKDVLPKIGLIAENICKSSMFGLNNFIGMNSNIQLLEIKTIEENIIEQEEKFLQETEGPKITGLLGGLKKYFF
jgi:hypothetical protein